MYKFKCQHEAALQVMVSFQFCRVVQSCHVSQLYGINSEVFSPIGWQELPIFDNWIGPSLSLCKTKYTPIKLLSTHLYSQNESSIWPFPLLPSLPYQTQRGIGDAHLCFTCLSYLLSFQFSLNACVETKLSKSSILIRKIVLKLSGTLWP